MGAGLVRIGCCARDGLQIKHVGLVAATGQMVGLEGFEAGALVEADGLFQDGGGFEGDLAEAQFLCVTLGVFEKTSAEAFAAIGSVQVHFPQFADSRFHRV